MAIKMELVDNDYVVRATTNLSQEGSNDLFRKFLENINDELLPGQTACLAIEGSNIDPIRFQISHHE